MLRVVIDANIVAAALVRPHGWTASQLQRGDVEFFAPEFLLDELREHADEYAQRAQCTRGEWTARLHRLRRRVQVVPAAALVRALDHALVRAVERRDPDDAPYAAALVATDADLLWTRDKALLQTVGERAVLVVPEAAT